ncbi:hypothetical protein RvVAR0630_21970 [Agrobacterium vitis]|nr:hypothetical protein RvVAR0630_21970 [Agrobacterium vitis]
MHDGRDITDIDAAGRFVIEKRATKIEIPMVDQPRIFLAGNADSIRSQGVTAAILSGIGTAVTSSENHYFGFTPAGKPFGKAKK